MANEKRMIELETLIDNIDWDNDLQKWALRGDPEEIHTVDAVEVVHGRWINPYMNRYGHPCHCCSVCGFKASYQDKNYCPNCGAKMDGDGNG